MKLFTILIFFLGFASCKAPDFNEEAANKLVILTQDDLDLYGELKNEILSDLFQIRKVAKTLNYATDTTFLGTNSYYLYQIDRKSYEPIIKQLKTRNIYIDDINTSYEGTLEFRLKENTDQRSLPHFNYVHTLVFNPGPEYIPPYSGQIEVLKDSTLNEKWSYIYFKAQVGH